MSYDMKELGKAFMNFGIALKNGDNLGLDEETMELFFELAELIPERKSGPPPWSEEKDPLGALILEWLATDQPIPSGPSHVDIKNALSRLRRNGLITNRGTRANPEWELTTEEERKTIVETLRTQRQKWQVSFANQTVESK